jgi:hypothetical protein
MLSLSLCQTSLLSFTLTLYSSGYIDVEVTSLQKINNILLPNMSIL